jgi:uncharacterized protein YmfQ (DUF2313 family)
MTTLSVKLPDKLVADLDRAAKAQRKTRTAFVRETLEQKAGAVHPKTGTSLLDRTENLCGIAASGLGDLSSNPKYLEDLAK